MVYDTQKNYSIHGVYKPTNITGGPTLLGIHLLGIFLDSPPMATSQLLRRFPKQIQVQWASNVCLIIAFCPIASATNTGLVVQIGPTNTISGNIWSSPSKKIWQHWFWPIKAFFNLQWQHRFMGPCLGVDYPGLTISPPSFNSNDHWYKYQ